MFVSPELFSRVNHLKLSSYVMIVEEVPTSTRFINFGGGTCLFTIVELLEMTMVVSPELFPRAEHLMLNKSSKCSISEIKHELLL